MNSRTRKKEDSRIELRVSKEDKELFEYASNLQGFKSFSEFARLAIQKEAQEIVKAERNILHSKRDQEIFYKAILGEESKPNEALISAMAFYNSSINDKLKV